MSVNIWMVIIEAILVAGVGILIRYVGPSMVQMLRAHNYMLAADIVETAVRAAEQTIRGYKRGSEKYEYAFNKIKRALAANGITITDDQIEQMIEAAVYALDYNFPEVPEPTEAEK